MSSAGEGAIHRYKFPMILSENIMDIISRDMKVASQIAENATPSIWGNPTVIGTGSNAWV